MLTNDTIFVVFHMYLVSHALCYTKIIRHLKSSPKVLETPLECCHVIAMLRGKNNIAKGTRRGGGMTNGAEFSKVFQGFCLKL